MSKIVQEARQIRRGWWLLWNGYATRIRGDWAKFEADWRRDTDGHPLSKTDRDRRDFALAWASLLEAIGGKKP